MREYIVRDNQDIFAIAVEVYGESSYAYNLANDNGILINDTLTGLVLEYDETVKQTVLSPLVVTVVTNNLQQTYFPRDNQSIFDVALMTNGGFEDLVELVRNSTLAGINSTIKLVDRFVYTDSENSVKTYIKRTGRVFVTGVRESEVLREHDDSFRRTQFT